MPAAYALDPHYSISIAAPARLHMGFLDLGGSLGRKFGSIGVGVNEIATRLSICGAAELSASGPGAERALKAAHRFAAVMDVEVRAALHIHSVIPEHIGLGSGTQMALAVGVGLARYYGLALSARAVARAIGRGARSGVGIAVFEQGGLIVDGGRGPHTQTPPVISRLEMPEAWRFILAFDRRGQGLHGRQELAAFAELPVFPLAETARLCHLLLIQALPALAEGDIRGFGAVITELQSSVGDHFAPAQGGRFTSPEVGAAMGWLEAQGAVGIGQTSWGPTGFCLLASQAQAETLMAEARRRWDSLDFLIASPRNQGADISPCLGPSAPAELHAE
jgi:beta-RFAP synthase